MGLIHGLDVNGNLVALSLGPEGEIQVFGQNPLGTPIPITVDSQGHLIVDGVDAAGTFHVLQTDVNGFLTTSGRTAGSVRTPHLTDGSGRQYIAVKGDDKIWSYDSSYAESVSNTNLAAGTNTLLGTVVPAGKILVVTNAVAIYVGTITNVLLLIQATLATIQVNTFGAKPTVSNLPIGGMCHLPLGVGDRMSLLVTGATAGDDAYLQYGGYFMETP